MLRVTYVCEFATRNGGENSLLSVLPRLAAGGIQPNVLCPLTGPFPDALQQLAIEYHELKLFDDDGVRLQLDDIRAGVLTTLQELEPDIVHANSLSTSRLCGGIADQLLTPIVGHVRDIMNVSGQVIRDLNKLARTITVSHATRDNLLKQGVTPENCEVVYNGVSTPNSTFSRSAHSQPDKSFTVGGVGQIGMRKGWDILLDAFGHLVKHEPNCQLEICGVRHSTKDEAIEYERALYTRAQHPDLQGKVKFAGYVEDIQSRMRNWDLLVHPARQEPLGRVLLEAAAIGLPIIATDVGGTREIFPNGEAILFERDNTVQLASQLMALHDDFDHRIRLATTGYNRIKHSFSLEESVNGILSVYRQLTDAE
jgi:glycosyltransferase involved in cell wall biosynthesis